MPGAISPDEERLIHQFSGSLSSIRKTQERLKEAGYIRSVGGITNVPRGNGKKRQARLSGTKYKYQRKRKVLTRPVLNSLKSKLNVKNPPTFEYVSIDMSISPTSVRRGVNDILRMDRRKKRKVQFLKDSDLKNRKRNARKLYETVLSGSESRFVVTLDEAKIYVRKYERETDYYVGEKEKGREKHVKPVNESFPQNFMIIGSMTENATFPLIKVPKKCTIDAAYYIRYVLSPLIHDQLIPHFGQDINKVVIHHDKASSHTAKKTRQFMDEMTEKFGIRFLEKEDIPVKGADISPLDFFGFGFIKQKIKSSRARTEKGIWKKCQETWSQVTPDVCKRVFDAWKRRCRMVVRKDGGHVEHTNHIHRRKIKKWYD